LFYQSNQNPNFIFLFLFFAHLSLYLYNNCLVAILGTASTGKFINLKSGHDQLLEICLLEKTGRHNFSTAQHYSSKCHFLSTGRIRLIFGDQLDSISFTFSQKIYQLLELQMVDKCFGKCQLLNTIYSKENGVHVWQLGSVRLGVRLG
jgi:hypothetical protein